MGKLLSKPPYPALPAPAKIIDDTPTQFRYSDPDAFIVFSGEADHWIHRFLRRGYRHCYMIIRNDLGWLAIEQSWGAMHVFAYRATEIDAVLTIARRGNCIVVPVTRKQTPMVKTNISLLTCVEMIKRYLRIKSRWVQTPWQLHKHMIKEGMTL